MKRRKRHTLLKFIILAVIAGGVVQYSGVLKDTGVFPEKITNQISVEQKNAKAETYSGTAEEQTVKSTEIRRRSRRLSMTKCTGSFWHMIQR